MGERLELVYNKAVGPQLLCNGSNLGVLFGFESALFSCEMHQCLVKCHHHLFYSSIAKLLLFGLLELCNLPARMRHKCCQICAFRWRWQVGWRDYAGCGWSLAASTQSWL